MYLRHKIHLHVPNNFRKRKATPVLAYLILEALSMIMWAILIVLILIGLQEAGSDVADNIANGEYEGLNGGAGSK